MTLSIFSAFWTKSLSAQSIFACYVQFQIISQNDRTDVLFHLKLWEKYSYGETIENKRNPCEKPAISQIVEWHRTPPPPKRTVWDFSKIFFANQYLALYTSPNPPQELSDEDCGHFIFFPPSHSIHSNTQGAELGKVFQKKQKLKHCRCVDKWGREFDRSRTVGARADCGQYGWFWLILFAIFIKHHWVLWSRIVHNWNFSF